jgi:hypothetical protein
LGIGHLLKLLRTMTDNLPGRKMPRSQIKPTGLHETSGDSPRMVNKKFDKNQSSSP